MCLSYEDMARQSYAIVHKWRTFGDLLRLAFLWSRVHTFQTCSKFALGPHHMADIQSATAEIRQGKI